MRVPRYVEERIRAMPPPRSCVVPGSTPVVAFGDASRARVATLGLNPSKQEFLSPRGRELDGDERRFETCGSLGVGSLIRASRGKVKRVLAACNDYFKRNPYRQWFDQLDLINRACGASYYKGTACHLDLVQWATDPTWTDLSWASWERLMDRDLLFLQRQLRSSRIRLLLLNGRSVVRQFEEAFRIMLSTSKPDIHVSTVTTKLFVGSIFDSIRVVGWSTNLQSSWGVSDELREKIAARVARLSR
jgi:hypothetical protein